MTRDHDPTDADHAVDPFDRGSDHQLNLLGAVLATDPRPSLVFSDGGELLLANAAAGARLVSEWSRAGRQPEWSDLVAEARALGACPIRLRDGATGQLCHIATGSTQWAELFLLRGTQSTERVALEQKADELARLSHDLRVPLQAVVVAVDRLASEAESVAAEAGQVQQVFRLALERINGLLELSRMDRVSPEAEPAEVFDLRALVSDMGTMLAPVCKTRGSDLVVSVPPEALWQSGPSHLVRAVIQNLVGNAAQAMTGGTIWLSLAASPSLNDVMRPITLEVSDTGPGMPESQRSRLRNPSGAAPHAVSGSGGFGLGIGIVTRAVARLGGKIDVAQRDGGGTTIRVAFEMQTAAPEDRAPKAIPLRLDGLRVLVVEDNPVNLAILLRTIADAGANAEGVTSGPDALARLEQACAHVDLVLLDVTMPGMDGIEVAHRIRQNETEGQHLLIVGLTAHVDPAVQGACLASGMDRVLAKPVGPSELRRALREIWNGVMSAGRGRKASDAGGKMLNDELVAELIDEMGAKAAVTFMRQALAEAQQVLVKLQAEGMTVELRRQVHSAIGSSGLTGLTGIEAALRLLQAEARANVPLGKATRIFVETIESTSSALEALAPP